MAYLDNFNRYNDEHKERRKLKFFIANQDIAGDTRYYGFVGNDTQYGNSAPWYILQENSLTGTYKYFFGNVDYVDAWSIRANLPYDYAYKFHGFHERYDIR